MNFIPIYEPYKAKNQKRYVLDCINSNWISSRGSYIDKFEHALQEYLGVKHAITVCNGSVSLMLILRSLGIGVGDYVLTPTLTYAATVSSINNVGAHALLVDSDESFQMTTQIEKYFIPELKAVLLPQLYGSAPDMDYFVGLCKKNNVPLIEDSAEVFGCDYNGKKLGTLGTASSFSFFGNKTITTGEGGCVCTDDDALAEKMRLIKNQSHIAWFEHNGPGYNFRMTNIQAAIGLAQLEQVNEIVAKKKKIAEYYRKHLTYKITIPFPNIAVNSSEWMPLFMLPEGIPYLKFYEEMRKMGIDTRPAFKPIHLMSGFSARLESPADVAEKIYGRGFNLPSFPDLKKKQLKYICDAVNKFIEEQYAD